MTTLQKTQTKSQVSHQSQVLKPQTEEKILKFIRSQHKADGSFQSCVFDSQFSTEPLKDNVKTTFIASLILSAIGKTQEPFIKTADFLLKEKTRYWSWNYWQRKSSQNRNHPCPDDWDDTSCALTALTFHKPECLTAEALVAVTKLLTMVEEKVGGPYNTWLVNKIEDTPWKDVDIVVNSNIAYFLKLHEVELPGIISFTEKIIGEGKYESLYYSPIQIIYFIARWYRGLHSNTLKEQIIKLQGEDGLWGDMLTTAIAVTSLARLGASEETYSKALSALTSLCDDIPEDAWQPLPFYIEGIPDGKPLYAGSSALTAALCFEALKAHENSQNHHKNTGTSNEEKKLHASIVEKVTSELSFFPGDLSQKLEEIIQKITQTKNGSDITLLPYRFASSTKFSSKMKDSFLHELGEANLHGWLAYKIFDDMLDNEGDPKFIPVANVSARKVAEIYERKLSSHYHLFEKMMDAMEKANAWERMFTYFPEESFLGEKAELPDYNSYEVLAGKSLPHCLGAVAVLVHPKNKMSKVALDKEISSVVHFFHHYIIARQLNDDAHDWWSDMKRGFVNSSGTLVLDTFRKQQKKGLIPIKRRLADYEKDLSAIFWKEEVVNVAEAIHKHINLAKKSLEEMTCLTDHTYLLSMLEPIQKATDQALDQRQKTLEFLEEYHKKKKRMR